MNHYTGDIQHSAWHLVNAQQILTFIIVEQIKKLIDQLLLPYTFSSYFWGRGVGGTLTSSLKSKTYVYPCLSISSLPVLVNDVMANSFQNFKKLT